MNFVTNFLKLSSLTSFICNFQELKLSFLSATSKVARNSFEAQFYLTIIFCKNNSTKYVGHKIVNRKGLLSFSSACNAPYVIKDHLHCVSTQPLRYHFKISFSPSTIFSKPAQNSILGTLENFICCNTIINKLNIS